MSVSDSSHLSRDRSEQVHTAHVNSKRKLCLADESFIRVGRVKMAHSIRRSSRARLNSSDNAAYRVYDVKYCSAIAFHFATLNLSPSSRGPEKTKTNLG